MNACAMFDFRSSAEGLDKDLIISTLRKIAKRYTFQLESGEASGYLHYQGRFSLIKKHRKSELMKMFGEMPVPNYLEPTVNATYYAGDLFYVSKEETRVEGPWDERVQEFFMPYQYEGILDKLHPFQQTIWNSCDHRNPRGINFIYDPEGCRGKSSIASIIEIHGRGIDIPPVNDMKELLQVVCDECYERTRDPKCMLIDMPRALDKSRLYGMFSAIEQIKKGKLYDMRYSYKKWWIHAPQIWVFSNIAPELSMLSNDRWNVWIIDDNLSLQNYEGEL